MSDTQWSFTTLYRSDVIPPRLASSIPGNLTSHVDIDANLSLTFTEAIVHNPWFLEISPGVGGFGVTWSNDGKTITYDPFQALSENQQYTVLILPGAMQDLAGNTNPTMETIVFTTGRDRRAPLPEPSPAIRQRCGRSHGCTVVASTNLYFANFAGVAIVAATTPTRCCGCPTEVHPDGVHGHESRRFPLPFTGDAVGMYGATSFPDASPDSVIISNGTI
jgi:hypothetical protein